MSERPNDKGRFRRSLGARISLSYALFLLRSLIGSLIIFSVVFWLCAGGNAANIAREAAKSHGRAGESLMVSRLNVSAATQPLDEQRLLGRVDGAFCLTIDVSGQDGRMYAAYDLRAEAALYRVLIIALTLIELVRMWTLLMQGEKISRRALRPIREIAETARGFSASNLSERIEIHGEKNELLELTHVLNDMLDRIEAAYNTQKQFVSDASHELRTPIAVIQGYADMLSRWGKKDPEVMEEAISAIRSEAAGMKELVEQLLYIARHDKESAPYEKIYFDASELVDEAYRDTRLIDKKHRIRYGEMHRAIILGDRAALKQALRVFVDNAIKYTPEGGEITLSCRKEEAFCRITVADTGMGVAEKELERIFERFYRADQARGREEGGHGLGLSIARIIIRAHGGRIEVQSKQGAGSRFHILLPL